ncbi:MAG: hypothetical protein ICV87_14945, partial [Gemmatimonadetes bacterium]|nr:hypothetical protein [Gemmatimonadota bacterium]
MTEPAPAELAELALARERLGRWDEAAALYSRVFRASIHSGAVEQSADALRGQARVRN